MNPLIVKIADKIARNEDITMDEFKKLKGYIYMANKWKTWNADDVVSNFVLDVREHYNPDYSFEEKEAWIYAHIKYNILVQAKFDNAWLLYNPVPVPITWHDMEWWINPEYEFQIKAENKELEDIYNILHTPFERDLYTNCILWDTPVAYIAKEYGKSAEWWRIIKDRISKRIKEYIENKGK